MRGVSGICLRCRLRLVERHRARGLHHPLGAPRFGDHGLALTQDDAVRATLLDLERTADRRRLSEHDLGPVAERSGHQPADVAAVRDAGEPAVTLVDDQALVHLRTRPCPASSAISASLRFPSSRTILAVLTLIMPVASRWPVN